ncbi:MAG: DUF547 domain-containing protein [Bacteroidia bacterium]|nr:DUF547 domain-containing protein [Bacteroidia bacterium]
MSSYTIENIQKGLIEDNARKVFWINLYNALYQILAIHENKDKNSIYTDKSIYFSDAILSLDDIEHGILRKYRWKYSQGYLPQFLPSSTIKKLAVNSIDYRIHFALNCGAKSCPPIAFYQYEKLDKQLDLAAQSFLENETTVDVANQKLHVTKIMQWFKGDFGGEKGIKKIITHYLGGDYSSFTIIFNDYDWGDDLKNFVPSMETIFNRHLWSTRWKRVPCLNNYFPWPTL